MDVRNAMSLAIVLDALLDELGLEFDPRLFFNTDVTTLFLKDLLESGRITKKSKKLLKKHRLGASRTQENSFQERTVSLMTTVSAGGQLMCTIVIIKDSLIESLEKHTVS